MAAPPPRANGAFPRQRLAPGSAPQACVLSSATLWLYAGSYRIACTLHALRISSDWGEKRVTWANQPPTTESAAAGRLRLRLPRVGRDAHVQAGADNGFLIRDALEGADAEQQLHSRDRGPEPAELVLHTPAADARRRPVTRTAAGP
jgi:large repetitive protein